MSIDFPDHGNHGTADPIRQRCMCQRMFPSPISNPSDSCPRSLRCYYMHPWLTWTTASAERRRRRSAATCALYFFDTIGRSGYYLYVPQMAGTKTRGTIDTKHRHPSTSRGRGSRPHSLLPRCPHDREHVRAPFPVRGASRVPRNVCVTSWYVCRWRLPPTG